MLKGFLSFDIFRHYVLGETLGKGTFGKVKLGEHQYIKHKVRCRRTLDLFLTKSLEGHGNFVGRCPLCLDVLKIIAH